MTTGTWPAADERLVRRYRRLLLAYSASYRRRHGTEMITTLLEMAAPGRSRPTAGEAWHLITSGVRQRFRLPSQRPFVGVTAVLVAVVLGLAGAAAGSWVGERTFADLPSDADTLNMLKAAVADQAEDVSSVSLQSEPGNASFLFLDVIPKAQRPDTTPTWTVEQARDGLAAAGWTITEFTIQPKSWSGETPICASGEEPDLMDSFCVDEYSALRRTATLNAERDGLVLQGYAIDSIGGEPGKVWVGGVGGSLFARRSAAYAPLMMMGGLIGALAGWLLVAALAYRRHIVSTGAGRMAGAFAGVAVILSILPVWAVALNTVLLIRHLTDVKQSVYTLHSVLLPGSYVESAPTWLIPGCALTAVAAASITVGILIWSSDRKEPWNIAQAI